MLCNNARLLPDNVKVEWILSNDDPKESILYSNDFDKIEIKYINTAINSGIQAARIRGYKKSTGEYILFLDQDDRIKDNCLITQINRIGSADAVICMATHEGMPFYKNIATFRELTSREYLISRGNGIISPGQVLIKRCSVPEIWLNNMIRNGSDDYLLWLGMLGESRIFAHNDNNLFNHVVTGINTSLKIGEMAMSTCDVFDKVIGSGVFSGTELERLKNNKSQYIQTHVQKYSRDHLSCYLLNRILCSEKFCQKIKRLIKLHDGEQFAIYGAGIVGRVVMDKVIHYGGKVSCFIDRNAGLIKSEFPVVLPNNIHDDVSTVIVTVLFEQNEVVEIIKSRYPGKQVFAINNLL